VSIPASLGVVLVALPLYAVTIERGVAVPEAQSILTSLTVFCGLGLLPLISSGAREAREGRYLRWWPWLLAAIMLVIYLVMIEIPPLRDFYELTPMSVEVIAILLAIAGVWTVAVHLIRRTGIVGRIEDDLWAALVGSVRRLRRGRA
jgi:cation-transporting ATPase E